MSDSEPSKPLKRKACPSCGVKLTGFEKQVSGPELSSIPEIQILLISNAEPVPKVRDELLSRQSGTKSRLAEITRSLKALESAIVRLKTERKVLELDLKSYKVILHPVRSVPADVWLYIFEMATISHFDPSAGVSLRVSKWHAERTLAPWSISQVCSSWRAVASLSGLWSYVALDLGTNLGTKQRRKKTKSALESSLFFLNRQLQKSGTRPLTLALTMPTNSQQSPFSRALLLSVTAHSERWRDVFITYNADDIGDDSDVLSSIRGALSSLCTLHFSSLESGGIISAFEFAPKLKELSLACDPSSLDDICLPWTQILDFHYRAYHNSQTSLELLNKMPNLVSCTFDPISPTDDLLFHGTHLQLVSLTSFTCCNNHGVHQVLENIFAPSLKNFELKDNRQKLTGYLDALQGFFQRSHCALGSFTFSATKSKSVDIISLLRILPTSLTKLSLQLSPYASSAYSGDVILKALHCHPTHPTGTSISTILPLLQDLDICSSQITLNVLDTFGSRQSAADPDVLPLKSVTLSGCSEVKGHELISDPRAIALQASGLHLQVSFLEPRPPTNSSDCEWL
ncbi:hypothetical protein BT96DRAFT_285189 [Gymnopus androsaceus JB14]|uniref:F-box domain-containing protein n=1 Tax=Gymnopus androsaceus JB14 TaxID=1447944 RepID=A0A6A4H276_9AGAR|nr:hypothetical protein BT96DRAFT_285189 [Gymnopus androsaceus JB14]